jgi:mevalonate kinase
MDSISFNSKILLFGEYGIMHDSNALSIPYKKFNGSLSKSDHLSEDQKISNRNIESLYEYIIQEDYLNDIINSDNLKDEIDSGLYFDSNIPIGSGLGSSGALVSSIISRYSKVDLKSFSNSEIKKIMSLVESKFHGNSSGFDPAVSYFNKPMLYSNQKIKLIERIAFKDFKVYIIDSQIDSSTKKMIKVFEDKISKSEFRLFFNSKFINNTNQCINHLINTSKLFRDSVKELSNDTLHNFQEMIPEKLKNKWKEGIKNDSYYMKLCGSGGGGFFLAYDFDNQINSSFSDFKIYQI